MFRFTLLLELSVVYNISFCIQKNTSFVGSLSFRRLEYLLGSVLFSLFLPSNPNTCIAGPQLLSPILGSFFLEREMETSEVYSQHSDNEASSISKHGMNVNKYGEASNFF